MKSGFLMMAAARVAPVLVVLGLLVGCSSTPDKPRPAELAPNAGLLGVRLAWTAKVGAIDFPLEVKVSGDAVADTARA